MGCGGGHTHIGEAHTHWGGPTHIGGGPTRVGGSPTLHVPTGTSWGRVGGEVDFRRNLGGFYPPVNTVALFRAGGGFASPPHTTKSSLPPPPKKIKPGLAAECAGPRCAHTGLAFGRGGGINFGGWAAKGEGGGAPPPQPWVPPPGLFPLPGPGQLLFGFWGFWRPGRGGGGEPLAFGTGPRNAHSKAPLLLGGGPRGLPAPSARWGGPHEPPQTPPRTPPSPPPRPGSARLRSASASKHQKESNQTTPKSRVPPPRTPNPPPRTPLRAWLWGWGPGGGPEPPRPLSNPISRSSGAGRARD